MKRKLVITLMLALLATVAFAQEVRLEPTQNPEAPYRLFSTQNIYMFS